MKKQLLSLVGALCVLAFSGVQADDTANKGVTTLAKEETTKQETAQASHKAKGHKHAHKKQTDKMHSEVESNTTTPTTTGEKVL